MQSEIVEASLDHIHASSSVLKHLFDYESIRGKNWSASFSSRDDDAFSGLPFEIVISSNSIEDFNGNPVKLTVNVTDVRNGTDYVDDDVVFGFRKYNQGDLERTRCIFGTSPFGASYFTIAKVSTGEGIDFLFKEKGSSQIHFNDSDIDDLESVFFQASTVQVVPDIAYMQKFLDTFHNIYPYLPEGYVCRIAMKTSHIMKMGCIHEIIERVLIHNKGLL